MDARVPFSVAMACFGVPATVTRPAPDATPIETTAVWVPSATEGQPIGMEFQRQVAIRVLALPRDLVPTVPRGTLVVAPEMLGGDVRTWRVDSTDRIEYDHTRVVVLPVES